MVQVCHEIVECKVSAERMWHGLFKDAHNCLPKALPLHVLAVEYPHAQHGFHHLGHERIIKLRKALCEEADEAEKHFEKEEALAKGEAEKIGEEVHKEGEAVKKKTEEVVCRAEEEAKKEEEGAAKEAHKLKEMLEEEAHKEEHSAEKEFDSAAYAAKKVLHKEAEEGHKLANKVEKALHKEEGRVGGAFHKVGAFLHQEELWIREKIEEVEDKAHKITISVLGGGLIGSLFKHCKHTFELKDTNTSAHGSILHWTSEFETLHSAIHHHHSFEKLKKHTLTPFHSVEAYLLEHDDYVC